MFHSYAAEKWLNAQTGQNIGIPWSLDCRRVRHHIGQDCICIYYNARCTDVRYSDPPKLLLCSSYQQKLLPHINGICRQIPVDGMPLIPSCFRIPCSLAARTIHLDRSFQKWLPLPSIYCVAISHSKSGIQLGVFIYLFVSWWPVANTQLYASVLIKTSRKYRSCIYRI